jgi:hypothetical protein
LVTLMLLSISRPSLWRSTTLPSWWVVGMGGAEFGESAASVARAQGSPLIAHPFGFATGSRLRVPHRRCRCLRLPSVVGAGSPSLCAAFFRRSFRVRPASRPQLEGAALGYRAVCSGTRLGRLRESNLVRSTLNRIARGLGIGRPTIPSPAPFPRCPTCDGSGIRIHGASQDAWCSTCKPDVGRLV